MVLHTGRIGPITAIAVLLGWAILGEPISLRKGIALVMILAGVVLLAGERPRAAVPARPPSAVVAPSPVTPAGI